MKKCIVFLLILIFPFNIYAYSDTSHSSIVMDIDSGRILYKNNIDNTMLIASTTKIMTAIIAIEKGNLNKKIIVGNEVLKMYGTNIYVEVGEKIKIKDLIYGLLLRSGNDASVVLAKEVAGNEKKFVKLMNKKANKLGMKNTIFKNPHGLDENTQNYSTARDMAILSRYVYKNKFYKIVTATKKHQISTGKKTYLWYNKNKLLTDYKFCTGGKNGFTPNAGKTLVTTASNNNLNLTIVSLDDNNSYKNHKELYEYIFNKYKKYKIIDKNKFTISKKIYNGKAYIKKSFYYPLTKEEVDNVKTVIRIDKYVNNRIGNIDIYLNKSKIGNIYIYKK